MPPPISAFVNVTVTLSADAVSDRASFGALMGAFEHSATANRFDGPFASSDELNDAGFDAASEPEVAAWASSVFGQEQRVREVYIGRKDALDADWTATLNAIEAEAGTQAWYATNIESRDAADIQAAAAWTAARNSGDTGRKILVVQSAEAAILAGTPGNVALALQASNYHQTALAYHRHSDSADGDVPGDGYLDGAWSSRCLAFDLDAPAGAGDWYHKSLQIVTPDDVTAAQAAAAWEANANLYGNIKGLPAMEKGTMASGRFIDVTTSMHWLGARIEESIWETFVGSPTRIPYTNAGIGIVEAATEAVFSRGIVAGHFSVDERPILRFPKVQNVSSSEKATRNLTATGTAVLGGGILSVGLNIIVRP